jgi:hypothetical protein
MPIKSLQAFSHSGGKAVFNDMTDGQVLVELKRHEALANLAALELKRRAAEEPLRQDS